MDESPATSRADCAGGAERTQIDVERAVRNQLYGERSELTVAPLAPAAVPGRRPAELLGGRYRLLSLIGTGGMTNVYCARDELLKRRVAMKVLAEPLASDARCLRQFRLEAELWAALAHPLIVGVFDAGTVPRPFIVMELVPAVSALALARGLQLTLDRAISIVAQVAEALTFAHEHDVIHRDASPGNVLIRHPDGAAKLTDFGLACRAGEEARRYLGEVAGTYGYMAPEVLRGGAASPLSDLYSLGALAYRLLGGPPERRSAAAAKLSAGVADVIERALEHDPDARQSSVAEFRAQLLAAHGSPGLVQSRAA
jgi:serine/threonine protein kinase